MPKETFRIDKFEGMVTSTGDGSALSLLKNARADIVPNLIPEYADLEETGTTYNDYKTITVRGVTHTIGITSFGRIVVDDVDYGAMAGDSLGNAKITIFGDSALIVSPSNSNVPAKIVTFGANLDRSVFDTNTTIVEDDVLRVIGVYEEIIKIVVLNAYLAVVLYANDNKLCFFVLDDFSTYSAGDIIACEENEFEIVNFAPHYSTVNVDYIVVAYYDGDNLCFARYDIASWFTAGVTSNHAAFVEIVSPTDILNGLLKITSISTPTGYAFTDMAVTADKIYLQYWGTHSITYFSIADDEDVLFSIPLSVFPGTDSTLSIEDAEISWGSGSKRIEKSKLPISDLGTVFGYYSLWLSKGIAIIDYAANEVAVETQHKVGSTYFRGLMCWSGSQPYTTDTAHPYLGIDGDYPKAFDTTANHSDGNCYRRFIKHNLGYLNQLHTLTYAMGYTGSVYKSIILIKADGNISHHFGISAASPEVGYMATGKEQWALSETFSSDLDTYFTYEHNLASSVVSVAPSLADDTMFSYENGHINNDDFTVTSWPSNITIDDSVPITETETGLQFIELTEVDESTGPGIAKCFLRYRYSFIYDGYQESPLSQGGIDTTNEYAFFSVDFTVTLTPNVIAQMSQRITGINIYAAPIENGEETEYYRLVKYLPFSYSEFSTSGENYEAKFTDMGSRLGSFDAVAGYSQAMESVSVSRAVQCAFQGYLFAGNVDIPSIDDKVNLNNIIVRSLPLQPSVFDYANSFSVLPFTATAMVGFNNRLYVFGVSEYAIVNPDTMGIEFKSDIIGCESNQHLVSTDYGLFVAFEGNIYSVNAGNVLPIGNSIKVSVYDSTFLSAVVIPSLADSTIVALKYLKKRNAIVVLLSDNLFLFSLTRNAWLLYDIPCMISGHADPDYTAHAAYEDSDEVHICYSPSDRDDLTRYTQTLFGDVSTRAIELQLRINLGSNMAIKRLYDTKVLPDNLFTIESIMYDGVAESYPLDVHSALLYVSRTARIDSIDVVYRRFVTKEY